MVKCTAFWGTYLEGSNVCELLVLVYWLEKQNQSHLPIVHIEEYMTNAFLS